MFESLRVGPQLTPKNNQIIKRNEDEEAKKKANEAEGEAKQGSNLAQSRGLKYVEDLQNGKHPHNPNVGGNNYAYNNQVQNAQMARPMARPMQRPMNNQMGVGINRPMGAGQMAGARPMGGVQQPVQTQGAQQTQGVSSSSGKMISPKINIAQVIGDFKNTAKAIGTPEDIYEEVDTYLGLVEKTTKKDTPNVKAVQSNLRNAAGLLDKYISDTLNKDSKVVENWVEAIFLQQVDYKYNTEDVNEAFLVKMPEDNKKAEGTEQTQPQQAQKVEPQKPKMDSELKQLFKDGKSASKAKDSVTALSTFQRAINRSIELGDTESQAKITFEVAQVYDHDDDLPRALENYNKAIETTTDNNVKVKAHYSMAQIYDDVKQFKPAIEHYMAAISFAGETDNFKAQTQSLTKIGNMYSDKYDKEAFNVYEDAKVVAEESKDASVKGYVSSSIANAYNKFNKPEKAMRYYSDAVKNYKQAGSDEKVAINYKKAGELMQDYQRMDKGKNLIQKAIQYAKKANNENLVKELEKDLQVA